MEPRTPHDRVRLEKASGEASKGVPKDFFLIPLTTELD